MNYFPRHKNYNKETRAEAMVQCLKLPARKVGYRGLEPHSGLQVSKKHLFLVMIQYCVEPP